jgi:hypothetical protein
MAPLLGIVASSVTANLGAFDSIYSNVVGVGGSSLIEFSAIPGTYKHLRLHVMARSTRTDPGGDLLDIRFNDATTGYYDHVLRANNGVLSADQNLNTQTHIDVQRVAAATNSANVFTAFTIDIPDYTSGSKVKSLLTKSGVASDSDPTTNMATLGSAFWNSTAAITKISIRTSYSLSFVQNSTFSLYGWKG